MTSRDASARFVDQDAYLSWSSARTALSKSIQAYSRASNALGSVLAHSAPHHPPLHNPLDNAFTEFESELALFHKEQEALQAVQTRLLQSANQSGTFAPINRLPVEVLSNIFIDASAYCADDDIPGNSCRNN